MSAATIAALRGMMKDEIQHGMQQMQGFVSEKNGVGSGAVEEGTGRGKGSPPGVGKTGDCLGG